MRSRRLPSGANRSPRCSAMRSPRRWLATLRRQAGRPADRSAASTCARGKARAPARLTARAGAQVEHALDAFRIADRQHTVGQHVADEGTRNEGRRSLWKRTPCI